VQSRTEKLVRGMVREGSLGKYQGKKKHALRRVGRLVKEAY